MRNQRTLSNHFEGWRIIVLYGGIGLIFIFYVYRLFSLQILNPSSFINQALENRLDTVNTQAQRGIIYDRNGFVLARNTAAYNLVITPANLPGYVDDLENIPGSVQEIYRQLSAMVGVPVSNGKIDEESVKNFTPCSTDLGIEQIVYIGYTNWPYQPVKIKCNISKDVAMTIQEKASDWPGVGIDVEQIREYPTGSLTSEIIGFLGPLPAGQENNDAYKNARLDKNRDKVGYAGIESEYQIELAGTNGTQDIEVDVGGKQVGVLGEEQPSIPGENIELTIDTRLQTAAKTAIEKELTTLNRQAQQIISTNAVVIAVNPKTGEILSLVNYPTYENNRMARIIPADYYEQLKVDPSKPLFDQAISSELPPGSVFKMASALGILNEGIVTPDKQIEDPGKITITQSFSEHELGTEQQLSYVCWKPDGHGLVNYLQGIAFSCDVYFYKVGGGYKDEVPEGLNIYRIGEYAKALGYSYTTGIELPGEATGLIPTPKYKRLVKMENWSTGDTYISTIGQGYVLATPLQVLMSVATIANDGKLMKPTLIKQITDSEGHVVSSFTPVQRWDITKDAKIGEFDKDFQPIYLRDANGGLIPETDEDGKQVMDDFGDPVYQVQRKVVAPWVVSMAKEGMRMVVTDGTGKEIFADLESTVKSAGKTGTAEYCDDIAFAKGLCEPGAWPAHAWYVGYAPYDNPEIAVVAFVYNGKEGSTVAGPIVRDVLKAYFELKKVDASPTTP